MSIPRNAGVMQIAVANSLRKGHPEFSGLGGFSWIGSK